MFYIQLQLSKYSFTRVIRKLFTPAAGMLFRVRNSFSSATLKFRMLPSAQASLNFWSAFLSTLLDFGELLLLLRGAATRPFLPSFLLCDKRESSWCAPSALPSFSLRLLSPLLLDGVSRSLASSAGGCSCVTASCRAAPEFWPGSYCFIPWLSGVLLSLRALPRPLPPARELTSD